MDIFETQSLNECIRVASQTPIPKMLFDEFWFENELCILFADTNLGKSILAVQIGDSISKGIPIKGFNLEAEKQKVIYFDFELSEKQLEKRYSEDYKNHYQFDDNFFRSSIKFDTDIFIEEDIIFEGLEAEILKVGATVVIIDNITYISQDNEKAKNASRLMKSLKSLKIKNNLSILILAHTPKRTFNIPISDNDLQGSKMSANFSEASFAIGKSYLNGEFRYIKQIKVRSAEKKYDTPNVCVCSLNKGTTNSNLQFEFIKFDNELNHLNTIPNLEKEEKITKIKQLKAEGKSNVAIAKELNLTEGAIRKILKK